VCSSDLMIFGCDGAEKRRSNLVASHSPPPMTMPCRVCEPSFWMGQSRMVSLLCKRTSSSRRSSTPLDSLQLPARRSHYEALGEGDGCERRAGFQFSLLINRTLVPAVERLPGGIP